MKIVVDILCLICFLVYFRFLSKDYFTYDTITDIFKLSRSNLPPIQTYLCINKQSLYKKDCWDTVYNGKCKLIREIENPTSIVKSLSYNGQLIKLGNMSETKEHVCYYLDIESNTIQVQDVFGLELSDKASFDFRFRGSVFINRNIIRDNPVIETQNILSEFYLIYFKYNGDRFDTNMISRLPPPYITMCSDYGGAARQSCLEDDNQDWDADKNCGYLNCRELSYVRDKKVSLTFLTEKLLYYNYEFIIHFSSSPRVGLAMFILQSLGLLTMFFELSVFDLVITIATRSKKITKWFQKNIKSTKHPRKKTKNSKTKKLINRFFRLVIFICCINHLSIQSFTYFSFLLNSMTYIGKPYERYTPHFSICIKVSDATYEKIGAQIFERVEKLVVDFCEPSFSDSSNDDIETTKYLLPRYACYKYSKSIDDISSYFRLNVNGTESYIHKFTATGHRDSYPRDMKFISLSEANINTYFLSRTYFTTLSSPYSSCIDYQKLGFLSKHDCYDKCIFRNFLDERTIPRNLLNDRYFNYTSKMTDIDENLISICQNICHYEDCTRDDIILKEEGEDNKKGKDRSFIFVPQIELSTDIIFTASMNLVDYLTSSMTIISFWLGLSIILFPSFIRKVIKPLEIYVLNIWLLVIVSICIYHVYHYLDSYMSYECVTKIFLGSKPSENFPTMSFAIEYNAWTAKDYDRDSKLQLSNMSPRLVNEIFGNVIDIIVEITIFDQDGFELIIKDDIDKHELISNFTDFYIFKEFKIMTIRFDDYRKYHNFNPIEKITFFIRAISYMKFLEKNYFEFPFYSDYLIPLDIKYSYFNISSKLLPAPYDSNCVTYSDNIKDNEWYRCLIESHSLNNQSLSYDLTLPIDVNILRTKSDNNSNSKNRCKPKNRPCDSIIYETKKLVDSEPVPNYVTVVRGTEATRTELVPKITIMSMTIFLSDIIGIWLGINVHFILRKLSCKTHH